MQFRTLPVIRNEEGSIRKVGFELEYANVGIDESLQIVKELYGGEIEKEHRFSQKIVNTSIGDFSIKIDLKLLNEKTYKKLFDTFNIDLKNIKLGERTLEDDVEETLEKVINKVIPYEIGTPPVPVTEIEQFEKLRKALHEHHAEGTKSFITNAFATHINPELPATDPGTIIRYIQAFLVLYPWLLRAGKTDFARRVTSFINPYPASYIKLVLPADYSPGLETLIDDYHQHNPDRNRPLDMYPLFAALRPEQVNTFDDLGNVKPRKTFHYRLPNSLISQPDWTLAHEWNNWVVIEELANAPEQLRKLCDDYLALKEETLMSFESKWVTHIEHEFISRKV